MSTNTNEYATALDMLGRRVDELNAEVIERETALMRAVAATIAVGARVGFPNAATVDLVEVIDESDYVVVEAVRDAAGTILMDRDNAWDADTSTSPDGWDAAETAAFRLNLHGPTAAGWLDLCDVVQESTRRTEGVWRLRIDDAMNSASGPRAVYVPPTDATDEDPGASAMLRCPSCEGTSMYEVDRSERWTEVEYGEHADPSRLTLHYGDDGDYESDHLRCAGCQARLAYPANWSKVLHEGF